MTKKNTLQLRRRPSKFLSYDDAVSAMTEVEIAEGELIAGFYEENGEDHAVLGLGGVSGATKAFFTDSMHKLDADFIDDTNTTNKFVTSAQIEAWNNKQDAPTEMGTQGQVLTLGAQGNPVWTTVSPSGTMDTEMSDSSTNPVQNKVIKEYVDSLGIFDISAYHATGGVLAKYANLAAALGTNGANIPEALRKGGMSIKYVQSSDNKYVQFRYMGTSTAVADFTNVANWQGVDVEVVEGSHNLTESNGVYQYVLKNAACTTIPINIAGKLVAYSDGSIVTGLPSNNNIAIIPVKTGDTLVVHSSLMNKNYAIVAMYNNNTYVQASSIQANISTSTYDATIEIPVDVTKVIICCGNTNGYVKLYSKQLTEYVENFVEDSISESELKKDTLTVESGRYNAVVGSKISEVTQPQTVRTELIDIEGLSKVRISFDNGKAEPHQTCELAFPAVILTDKDEVVLFANNTFVNNSEIDLSSYPTAKYLALVVFSGNTDVCVEYNKDEKYTDEIEKNKSVITVLQKDNNIILGNVAADFTKVGAINKNSGQIITDTVSTFRYCELEVKPNSVLRAKVHKDYVGNFAVLVVIDTNGNVISDYTKINDFDGEMVLPSNAAIVRLGVQNGSQDFSAYYGNVQLFALESEVITKQDDLIFANLPEYCDFVVGRKSIIYLSNIGKHSDETKNNFYISQSGSYGPTGLRFSPDVLIFEPTATGTNSITFNKRKDVFEPIAIRTTKFRAVNKNTGSGETKNILFIGDSLIQSGDASEQVYNMLVEDGDYNIVMMGDHIPEVGGVPQPSKVNAGHGSWSWNSWTNPDYEDTPLYGWKNKFMYNGALNFEHFVQENYPSASGIDIAIISLGTNDMGQTGSNPIPPSQEGMTGIVNKAKTFIDALLSDYPNCKIAIGIPNGGAYFCPNGGWFYPDGARNYMLYYAKAMIDTFDNGKYNQNVTCVYHGWYINQVYDYPHFTDTIYPIDGVQSVSFDVISNNNFIHPYPQGYRHWGVGYYNKIRAFLAGVL